MNICGVLRRSLLFIGLSLLISPCQRSEAASNKVWHIGNFDESSVEFSQGPLFSVHYPEAPVVYIVGKSDPEKDWPAFQPGTANGAAGYHPYPFTIQFELPNIPKGLYTLKVALLVETARVPALRVGINGHEGLFYQHPSLNYAGGDLLNLRLATYAADTIAFDFPARFLHQGTNSVVLTAVDEPAARDDETNPGITYDALSLEQDPAGKYPEAEIKVDIEPTIFFVHRGSGLSELVDVFIRHNSPLKSGAAMLTLAGEKIQHPLTPGAEFGEQLAELSVPEFASPAQAKLAVTLNGNTQSFSAVLTPSKKWTVFAVPHEHIDVGYPDYQAKVAEVQSRVLDEAIDLIHEHPDFRFSPDGYWSARQFLAGRSKERQEQLFQMVKDKKIFVPTQEASLLTGFPALETLIRSLYPGFQFNQEHGGNPDYANITDVPSYSWSYASVMAAAGLKYFFSGSDNGRGPILVYSHLNQKSPFWWEGPDGGKILMWYSFGYSQVSELFGLRPLMAAGRESLPLFLQAYSSPDYKSDAVLLYGTQVENTDLFPQQATIPEEWGKLYAYPRIQYSGFVDALKYIAGQAGDSIPVVRGDGGPYWEDGIISTTRSATLERETEQRALAAEKFSTISNLVNPRLQPDSEVLRLLWNDMVLFDEHTFGADRSISDPKSEEAVGQLATKEHFVADASQKREYVLRRALDGIADFIHDPQQTLVIFNPLNWQRTGLVETDLDKGRELVDLASNQAVPYQVISVGESYRHVRFLARDVPSVGYKAYALRETKQEPPTPPAVESAGIMENQFYRVALDVETGAVKSIFDKELNKELVDASSTYRFDQYIYVTGADGPPNLINFDYDSRWSPPALSIHGASGGHLLSVTKEPQGIVARLESSGINTPHIKTEITLLDGQKKIEFINCVHKEGVYTKEGIYFAFPFAMKAPRYRYETQNGFVDPSRDQMPGAGNEWFSVQHWIAADQDGVTAAIIPVDAPMVTLGDVVRGTWAKEFGKRSGTIFSYIMNNYWFTNYVAAQGGDFRFRYVLTSGKDLEPASLSRLGWEEMTPLEVDQITSQDKAIEVPRPLDSASGSFLQVDQPDVALVTWKRAEDGDGTIMRFLEIGGKESTVNVQTNLLNVQSAWTSDAFERKQGPLTTSAHGFKFMVKPFQILTVRVNGTASMAGN